MIASEFHAVEVSRGETPYRVGALCLRCGGDVSVTIRGGTGAHVGAVSLALYEPERDSATVSTITAPGHRDDAVAARFAKELARALRCTVSASAGLHIDGASAEDIALLLQNSEQCLQALRDRLMEAGI